MGNSQSQEKPQEKHDNRRRERDVRTMPPPAQPQAQVQAHSHSHSHSQSQPAAPVSVPVPAPKARNKAQIQDLNDPDGPAPSSMTFSHAPRLPIPIGDQLHTPGSPVLSPEDLENVINADRTAGLPHQTSLLSHTTMDDEEDVEVTEPAYKGMTVPTLLEWKQPGHKVYITGSFSQWAKKYRMSRDPDTGTLHAMLELPPGTHHVKFIVDGDMQLSKDLPTAVDFANVLVNYIEVSADDLPDPVLESKAPDGVHPPMVLPAGTDTTDFAQQSKDEEEEEGKLIYTKGVRFGNKVPQYLLDLDRPEQSHRFQRAESHLQEIPTPPTLPLFLSKSILNGVMPLRDDISVLNMPNHTVLNHVATSSIKNEVLATSMTTRYKAKYVTTLIYRAIVEEE